jgi:hypothetical protein
MFASNKKTKLKPISIWLIHRTVNQIIIANLPTIFGYYILNQAGEFCATTLSDGDKKFIQKIYPFPVKI